MPRRPRVLIDDVPYHITQRGNHKQQVFLTDGDRIRFLMALNEQAEKHGLRVLAYCLMTNHVHLIVVPEQAALIPCAMRTLFREHAVQVNFLRNTTGHLWEARFASVAMDRAHLYYAIRYVELNPVKVSLVDTPEQWKWSSAREHLGLGRGLCLLSDREWRERFNPRTWREWMDQPADALLNERLREATRSGRPLGSAEFVADMENRSGLVLNPKRPGRPRSADRLPRSA